MDVPGVETGGVVTARAQPLPLPLAAARAPPGSAAVLSVGQLHGYCKGTGGK